MPKIPLKPLKKFFGLDREATKYLTNVSRFWQRLGQTWGIAIETELPAKNVNMQQEIKKLVAEFKKEHKVSAYDINNGMCSEFADELVKRTGGKVLGLGHTGLLRRKPLPLGGETWSEPDLPGHVWLYWKGKHYDAENIYGVTNWKELKIFKTQVNWKDFK